MCACVYILIAYKTLIEKLKKKRLTQSPDVSYKYLCYTAQVVTDFLDQK